MDQETATRPKTMEMRDFDAFIDAIASPALRKVALHWNEARGTRRMPAWRDIDPAAIAPQLPMVWSYKHDSKTDEFIGRLAGDRIEQVFGRSLRGARLSELHSAEAYAWVSRLCKRVITEPALYKYAGPIFIQLNHYGSGERIILPLSSDNVTSDGILGATEYPFAVSRSVALVRPSQGVERWLSLATSA